MTTQSPQFLYLLDEDLYRLGNATSSRLDNIRSVDVDTYQRNGIMMVRANGKGISLGTLQYLERLQLTMTTPAPMPTVTIRLTQNDARFVLEALQMLESKWLEINHTSTDENEQADYGMDALDLHGTWEFIEREAVKAFGENVKNFSRAPIPVTPTVSGS